MNDLINGMKKLVAITVAGAAAVLVATWSRARRENATPEDEIAMEPGVPPADSPPEPAWATVSDGSSKAELYEVAQKLDIKGRSGMNKEELLKAIRAAR